MNIPKKSELPLDAEELRRQANLRLAQRQADSGQIADEMITEDQLRRVQHELQVHQIELEMQNEELQTAKSHLEFVLAEYTDLYDFAPTGYFTLGADGTILAVNLAGASQVGVERGTLRQSRFGAFVAPESRADFSAFLAKLQTGESRENCEVRLESHALAPSYVRIEGVKSREDESLRLSVMDVTKQHESAIEREALVASLQESLAKIKVLSSLLPICSNCKRIRDGNGAWCQIESCISSHTNTMFSHGICPECSATYFPEYQ